MNIIIDLQGLQISGNRSRGIGRYCLEFTKAIIKFYPENEYTLFTNSALLDLKNDFAHELNNEKLKLNYFECPTVGDLNESFRGRFSSLWSSTFLRSYALSIIKADIILITSFFDGFRDNTVVSHEKGFRLPPIVSILYDLIPLINSDEYLNIDPEYKLFYLQKVNELSKLDALLTISKSSFMEASKYLTINDKLIFNISSACDTNKFSKYISNDKIDKKCFGKFLLYCGATDPRKNLYRLIKAYASLSLGLIFKHKLVLAGPYTEQEILLIQEWMINCGLPPEYVIFLGFVTDIELAHLYRTCHLLIFPSLHEGFGLPVLEAMNCGAPVIASNSTSLPELVGDQKFLFDPYNVKDMTSLITKSLVDDDFYQEICVNSKERLKYFSWQITAQRTIDSLKKIVQSKSLILDQNEENFLSFMDSQYQILSRNLIKSPLMKSNVKSKVKYLKSLASAIALINTQSKKIEFIRRVKSNKKINWHIEGPFDSTYSLAILNKNYALGMKKLGQDVSLFCTDGPGDYQPDPLFLKNNILVNDLFERGININDNFFICTRNLYPPRVKDVNGIVNLLHAYGWEESEFPKQFADEFNVNLQGISVMSEQVKKCLIDNGVYLPIKVTGLGVDHLRESSSGKKLKLKANKFKILHVSSCFPRKGIDILLKAFGNTFTSQDDVSLIIKTFDNPHNLIDSLLDTFKKTFIDFPDVIVIKEEYDDSQIKSLYFQSDLLVAPSRGEGFGLPIAEAMSLGIPVITTNWGGQKDFCNEKNSWLIDYEFVSSESHFSLDNSYWAEPSLNHLCYLLRKLYDLDDTLKEQKIIQAKKDIDKLKWEQVALSNLNFVKGELTTYPIRATKLGCISTWNSKCGIASYSKNLFKHITDEAIIFSPRNEELPAQHGEKVIPSWDYNSDLLSCSNLVIDSGITSLIIQFNYGFFEFNNLSEFINKIHSQNINIIIILHSTIDPDDFESKKLCLLFSAFSKCQRLIVHTINDLNRLKRIGLIDNVCLLPHPICDYSLIRDQTRKKITIPLLSSKVINISSYGFCLPNKGFKELILAANILIQDGFDIKLSIYSAIYNKQYQFVFNELVDLVGALKLKKYISLNSTYMADDETIKLLRKSDFLVFPYQFTNESSSAAVRHGLSTFRPVLVTPLPIFDDISNLVYYLDGFSPDEIAVGIKKFVLNNNNFSTENYKIDSKKIEIINQRSFSNISLRFLNMVKSLELNFIKNH